MGELGMWLVRAREARGLTVEDAERDTRISRRYLQALETENFELIPAPVYARGFLRSYSQYLGLDPAEMLSLFPGEDDAPTPVIGGPRGGSRGGQSGNVGVGTPPAPKPTMRTPISGQSAARPQWNKPRSKEPPMPKRPTQRTAPAPLEPSHGEYEIGGSLPPPPEPMIGVDIGVPVPSRKLQADPAAQQRNLTVIGVAAAVIVGVIALALIISRLGGGGDPTPDATPTSPASISGASSTPTVGGTGGVSGIPVTQGIVPEIVGVPITTARLAIAEAGYRIREIPESTACSTPGVVTQVAPAAGTERPAGDLILVSVCPQS